VSWWCVLRRVAGGAGGELAVSIPVEPLGIRQPHDLAGSRNTAAGDAKIGYAIETAMLRPPGDTERIGAPAWVDSSGPVAPAFAPFVLLFANSEDVVRPADTFLVCLYCGDVRTDAAHIAEVHASGDGYAAASPAAHRGR